MIALILHTFFWLGLEINCYLFYHLVMNLKLPFFRVIKFFSHIRIVNNCLTNQNKMKKRKKTRHIDTDEAEQQIESSPIQITS